jgi:hypothetical protein
MKRMEAIRLAGMLAVSQIPVSGLEGIGAYQADISTAPVGTQRLFLSAGVPAPVGTSLWVVADRGKDGLIQGGEVTPEVVQGWVEGTGDDARFWEDTVDGFALGDQVGVYQHGGVDVPEALYAQAHIYILLWNDASGDGVVGNAGDTFGAVNLGLKPPGSFGNAEYSIETDLLADQFRVSTGSQPTNSTVSFVSWSTNAFPADTPDLQRVPAADPDKDQLVNQMEYLLGTDPMKQDVDAIRREVVSTDLGMEIRLQVTIRKDRPDAYLQADSSPDLALWKPVPEEVISETADTRTLRYTLPTSPAGQGYLRLNVVTKP